MYPLLVPANPGRITTVLGRLATDLRFLADRQLMNSKPADFAACPGAFNVLCVSGEQAAAAGHDFFKDINKPWLAAAVARNDLIALVSIPLAKGDLIEAGTGRLVGNYAREVHYLVQVDFKPFNISADTWAGIKRWFTPQRCALPARPAGTG